ncbi:MFS transporter [Nocardiopsis sp. NPDC049922]|uniref:MFS transporter n=1 Tax=Nocardiopsis sp. NPDC049922 TaxID=3155157 RepID=UPI0033F05DC5
MNGRSGDARGDDTVQVGGRVDGCVDRRAWFAVSAVALGIFALMTTELLPVGLLTFVSADLSVSDGTAGLMVTVPGVVAAATAPTVAVLLGRVDRRTLLAAFVALMAAANVACALAEHFALVLAARALVGVSIGGFWAIAGGLAPRLVPERHVPRATAVVFGGVSSASVIGVPVGTLVGDLAGWRAAFLTVAALGGLALVLLLVLLPPVPARAVPRLSDLPSLLVGHGGVRTGVLLALLLVTGQFTAYTFVRPLLTDVAGIDATLTGGLLLVYGVAGIVGNFVAGSGRDVRRTLFVATVGLTAALGVFGLAGGVPIAAVAALVVWGLAYGGVSVGLQTWMLRHASEVPEAATALLVCAFNLSIALGALVGGLVADALAVAAIPWVAGALIVLAGVVLAGFRASSRRS